MIAEMLKSGGRVFCSESNVIRIFEQISLNMTKILLRWQMEFDVVLSVPDN